MSHSEQSNYQFLLGSKSPRRRELLDQLGLDFKTIDLNIEENFPSEMKATEVARFLAEKKGRSMLNKLDEGDVLITADTVVILDEIILGKPADKDEAISMIKSLSGRKHMVMTGVALTTSRGIHSFDETTIVEFYELSDGDIEHYVEHFKPYDKAGAYGIQEWIGLIAVKSIQGCFFNVIGLPVPKLWSELEQSLATL